MQSGDHITGRYRLLRLIGAGGMGEVWAARNELTNRDFAIKFLLPEFAHQTEAFERFVREASITGRLQHPSIVDVFDIAQTPDGRPFIVMELLTGEDLASRLSREGTLPALRIAAYFAQIATALELAHQAGVVHRDLSAPNIFLARTRDGGEPIPKILDFGVSKSNTPGDGQTKTSDGAILGNPTFMSPEQARGAELVDSRTDVWSMGILMYQCLAGTPPFRAQNYNALMFDIISRPHRPLGELVPRADNELVEVIEACLVKDRERRLASAKSLAAWLTAIAHRLASDPRDVGRMPRRRATDRLLAPSSDLQLASGRITAPPGMTAGAIALPPRRLQAMLGSRWALGIAAAVAGAATGILLTQVIASQLNARAVSEVPKAMRADEMPRAKTLGSVGHESVRSAGRTTGELASRLDDSERP